MKVSRKMAEEAVRVCAELGLMLGDYDEDDGVLFVAIDRGRACNTVGTISPDVARAVIRIRNQLVRNAKVQVEVVEAAV